MIDRQLKAKHLQALERKVIAMDKEPEATLTILDHLRILESIHMIDLQETLAEIKAETLVETASAPQARAEKRILKNKETNDGKQAR